MKVRVCCGMPLAFFAVALGWAAVKYPMDDFDDLSLRNDFFGNSGVWADGGSEVKYQFVAPGVDGVGRCLRLRWRVVPGTKGCGWWMDLAPRWDGQVPVRDMRSFRGLTVMVKGSGFRGRARLELELEYADGTRDVLRLQAPGGRWRQVRWDLAPVGAGKLRQASRISVVVRPDGREPAAGELWVDEVCAVGDEKAPQTDDELLELLERRAWRYFVECQHPHTGLVLDVAGNWRRSSIAACGFGLAALCIGAERGWMERREAAARAERMLRTLLEPAAGSRMHGFFYHFLDASTGRPLPRCEVSSVDTAILAAGALCASAYFSQREEADVRALAGRLYREIEWPWLLDRDARLFSMGWRDGHKLRARWNWYTDEALLICLLAIGSPTHAVGPDVMWAFRRPVGEGLRWDELAGRFVPCEMVYTWTGSLFTYFMGSLWIDLRGLRDRHPHQPMDWWENSQRAALANCFFCRRWFAERLGWRTAIWGASACLGPHGYGGAYGAPPCGRKTGPVFDGTVTPAGPAMALPALAKPKLATEALWEMVRRTKLWGLYGLRDGFNPGAAAEPADDWCAHNYVGVNMGLALLGIENYRSAMLWRTVGKCPEIRRAVEMVFRPSGASR